MEKSNYKKPDKVPIIGVPISVVSIESTLKFVHENFEQIRGEYICASNVHTTVMAYDNVDYWKVQNESVLSLPDGKPLSVIGKKRTGCIMEKVTGLSFMRHIFSDPRFSGKKHFFYGTQEDTLKIMIERIQKEFPQLNICGYKPSAFRELSDEEIIDLYETINESKADFIWVALGAPRQEILMHRLKGSVNGIMCGVGGAFNILAGIVKNAPKWMQDMGLEWFFRLINEPKRLFRRYLVTNTKFIWYLLQEK